MRQTAKNKSLLYTYGISVRFFSHHSGIRGGKKSGAMAGTAFNSGRKDSPILFLL
jgi:hypothetical protein